MTLKSHVKFKEKLTWGDKRNFGKLSPIHTKVQKFHFNGQFLFKVFEIWAKKIQKSYLSWYWTVMQNLNKLWHVVSKMAWGIGWTFIREPKSLKILHWWALFDQNIYCFSKKISGKLCVMTLEGVAKFKGKLTCGLKNNKRNLVNFHASSWKSKNLHFDWIHLSQTYKNLYDKVRSVMSHDTEEWCKV